MFCSISSRDEKVEKLLHAMNLQFQFAEPQVYILAPNHSWEDVIVPTHLIRSGKYVEKKLCGLTPMLNVVNKCLQGTA